MEPDREAQRDTECVDRRVVLGVASARDLRVDRRRCTESCPSSEELREAWAWSSRLRALSFDFPQRSPRRLDASTRLRRLRSYWFFVRCLVCR
jgi:hypothetical protein